MADDQPPTDEDLQDLIEAAQEAHIPSVSAARADQGRIELAGKK